MNNAIYSADHEIADLYVDLLKRTLTASVYPESAWRVIERSRMEDLKRRASLWSLPRRTVQKWLIRQLERRSIFLVRANRYNESGREGGVDWPCFGLTMTGHRRIEALQRCIQDVLKDDVPGDFIETGVWRGGTVIFMRAMLKLYGVTDRIVWAADSFEGMPRPRKPGDGWDFSDLDYLRVSLDAVKENFSRFGLLDDQVRFLPGWFCDTLPSAPIKRLAILRLDGDLYHSTIDALRNLHEKISPGGYVIVDDYFGWEGCRRAVDEYRASHAIQSPVRAIDSQSVFWRV